MPAFDPGPEDATVLVELDREIRAILAAALDQVPASELCAPPYDTIIAGCVDNLRVISREPVPEWAVAVADDYRNGRTVTPVELRRPRPRQQHRRYRHGRDRRDYGMGPRWNQTRYADLNDDEEEDDR